MPATAFVLVEAALSLSWRLQHDSSLMVYIAWMIDAHGAVPYRDILDINMPGTYLVSGVIGHLTRYSDLGFRIGDLTILAAILALTAKALRPFGWAPAWGAAVLFAHGYLGTGPLMSLQREFLILLPFSGAVAVMASEHLRPTSQAFFAGLLFGLAATVKPQALIGLAWAVAILVWNARAGSAGDSGPAKAMKILLLAGLGVILPLGLLVGVLASMGALIPMLDLFVNYAPIYNSVSGLHRVMADSEWGPYLVKSTLHLGGHGPWLISAALGMTMVLSARGLPSRRRRFVVFVAGLVPLYVLYVTLQRRFFDYHWLIAAWLLLVLSALCLTERPQAGRRAWVATVLPLALVTVIALDRMTPGWIVLSQLGGASPPPPREGRVDHMASFFRARLRECDTVQPLGGTGGAVHAMLVARAPLATSFLYDSYLYLRLSRPYVQELRRRFLREFDASRPRFVAYALRGRPYLGWRDTPEDFPELEEILERDYIPVSVGLGTIIFERIAGDAGSARPGR